MKYIKFIISIIILMCLFTQPALAQKDYKWDSTGKYRIDDCLTTTSNNLRVLKTNSEKCITYNQTIDLRDKMPIVFDQGSIGSCTAQAVNAVLEYNIYRITGRTFNSSKLYTYYMTRLIEHNVDNDDGAYLYNACLSTVKYGIVNETAYPEDLIFSTTPSFNNLVVSLNTHADSFYKITSYNGIISSLINNTPVIISTSIYDYGNLSNDGICREALKWNVKNNYGGHAMLIVGYLPYFKIDGITTPVFIVRNSWGTNWGDNGYCYVPATQLYLYNIVEAWAITYTGTNITSSKEPTVTPDDPIFKQYYGYASDGSPTICLYDKNNMENWIFIKDLDNYLSKGYTIPPTLSNNTVQELKNTKQGIDYNGNITYKYLLKSDNSIVIWLSNKDIMEFPNLLNNWVKDE